MAKRTDSRTNGGRKQKARRTPSVEEQSRLNPSRKVDAAAGGSGMSLSSTGVRLRGAVVQKHLSDRKIGIVYTGTTVLKAFTFARFSTNPDSETWLCLTASDFKGVLVMKKIKHLSKQEASRICSVPVVEECPFIAHSLERRTEKETKAVRWRSSGSIRSSSRDSASSNADSEHSGRVSKTSRPGSDHSGSRSRRSRSSSEAVEKPVTTYSCLIYGDYYPCVTLGCVFNNQASLLPGLVSSTATGNVMWPKPLALGVLRHILFQVAKGIQALHAQHTAHGCLSTDSLLITPDLRVRLTNIGVFPTDCTRNARWCSPEMARSKSAATPPEKLAADVWAFGCIALNLATGKLPFPTTEDPFAIMTALTLLFCQNGPKEPSLYLGEHTEVPCHGETVSLDSIGRIASIPDPYLCALIKQCLEIDYQQRPTISMVLRSNFFGTGTYQLQPLTFAQVLREGVHENVPAASGSTKSALGVQKNRSTDVLGNPRLHLLDVFSRDSLDFMCVSLMCKSAYLITHVTAQILHAGSLERLPVLVGVAADEEIDAGQRDRWFLPPSLNLLAAMSETCGPAFVSAAFKCETDESLQTVVVNTVRMPGVASGQQQSDNGSVYSEASLGADHEEHVEAVPWFTRVLGKLTEILADRETCSNGTGNPGESLFGDAVAPAERLLTLEREGSDASNENIFDAPATRMNAQVGDPFGGDSARPPPNNTLPVGNPLTPVSVVVTSERDRLAPSPPCRFLPCILTPKDCLFLALAAIVSAIVCLAVVLIVAFV